MGIGASRQDVNVSVRGGRRVEIKGVPQAFWARKLVHGEAVRQVNLLRLRDELHRRGFTAPDAIAVESIDVTDLFASSSLTALRRDGWDQWVKEQGRRSGFELGAGGFTVRAARLVGLSGTLSWPTQPDYTFAHELAGRVRVIAGLDQRPILLHSEKWPDYQGSLQDLRRLRARLRCGPEDGAVVVWGPAEDADTAINEIRIRYGDATLGVPNETRQPFRDGSTDFERILPGPDRMYPDTDSPPTRVTRERVERLEATPRSAPVDPGGRLQPGRRAQVHDLLPDPAWRRAARRSRGSRGGSRRARGVLSVRRAAEGPREARRAGRAHPGRPVDGVLPDHAGTARTERRLGGHRARDGGSPGHSPWTRLSPPTASAFRPRHGRVRSARRWQKPPPTHSTATCGGSRGSPPGA